MNIDRNNYEEFFMLYADNELSAAQREAVELFVAGNPDLQQELEMFSTFKLDADETIVFNNKQALLKRAGTEAGINSNNCEAYFVLYADNELRSTEKHAVEVFVFQNPSRQQAFDLLQLAKLHADPELLYQNKESLYRYEADERVIPFHWWRMAAAAAVILFIGGALWLNNARTINQNRIARNLPVLPVKNPPVIPAKALPFAPLQNNYVEKETLAGTGTSKQSDPMKNMRSLAAAEKKVTRNHGSTPVLKPAPEQKQILAMVQANEAKPVVAAAVDAPAKKVDPRKLLIGAAQQAPPDQPAIILNPDENDRVKASFASGTNDNVEVLNTSVNTKSSVRGFFRKASRLIGKKSGNDNQDGPRKGILIGGFEIAVR